MEGNDRSPAVTAIQDTNGDPGKIFVGGLSKVTNADRLKEYFSKYGEIKECLVMRDPVTKNSRCFGFVTFQDPASVEDVVGSGPHSLDDQTIDPKVAIPKRPQPKFVTKTKKVFVGGLSPETTEDDLRSYFQNNYGKVSQCLLMFDTTTKRHRGFGFVTFENEEIVDKICEERFHKINEKRVETKKAQPREVMNPQNRGRGRGIFGRGYGYYSPFPAFGSFPAPLGYPLPGYQAAAAANAAYTAAQQQQPTPPGKQPRSAEQRTRPTFTYTYPSLPNYYSSFINPSADRRPHYYAEYANLSSPGLPATPASTSARSDGQTAVEYSDYTGVQVNGYSPQSFAAPPSPLSRFAPTSSPGPMIPDLANYISSATENALGYSASSPQTTTFAHPMAISLRQ
ncbi:RNA-binding protein Musashi homolog 2-like isoform X2 [Xenia sp. Carnegie-2017]|uniref:RNA-binding protein Musashi homolog 2-like isoform X2 n=1 Tax=Xenia sp. Carnegie-2017 TaxID=2897299 RepID=UPI001F042926|nr:RNA-binding protein Musashi homolog 2-like isoform X2 [Xenia sp. Carnegie-2017]XP_046839787.1 RNA-binding protein Musashi homolog 2-like isoform X2 [Xenia sp. Carnegie-2017]